MYICKRIHSFENPRRLYKFYIQKTTILNRQIFKKASAYIFPSLSEGFGIPGLNAMAAGLPVVCSDIPVLHEVYGEAAIYFNPHDPKDIAQKIKKVLTSDTGSELVKKGRKQVKKYSWQKMAAQTLSVYKEIVNI